MWLFGLVRSRVTNCDPARHKQVIGVRGRDSWNSQDNLIK
jgi:hypothetical protein